MKYHSALKEEQYKGNPINKVKFPDGSTAFKFDINIGKGFLPVIYTMTDILYTEIAWKAGLDKFNERAGVSESYAEYMNSVRLIIENNPQPVVIVAGKNEGKFLPEPQSTMNITLNGAKAVAYFYRMDSVSGVSSAKELLSELALRFHVVGDFCCGYGRSGVVFKKAGKRFIMSDYNGKCIAYIRDLFNG